MCNLLRIVANRMEDAVVEKVHRKMNSAQQGQKNFRKESGPDGVSNSFIVFADASHGDLPAAEAAPDVVTDLEQFTTVKVNPPFVYM